MGPAIHDLPAPSRVVVGERLQDHGARNHSRPKGIAGHAGRRRIRFSGEQREAFRRLGFDPSTNAEVRELIEAGHMPIQGGATGMEGAAFMHNLPPEGTYLMSSEMFAEQTERNDVPQMNTVFPGLGGSAFDFRISNVGVLANVKLIFTGSLVITTPTGTCTTTYKWPHGILSKIAFSANGQTSLKSCEGTDLRMRRQRIYRNPRDHLIAAPNIDNAGSGQNGYAPIGDPQPATLAAGTYPIFVEWDLPMIHDWYTLTGAIFSQSDQIYLSYRFTPAAVAELFTLTGTATATLTGNVATTNTFFDVPFVDTNQGRKVLIPDLQWLHGFVSSDLPYANTGDVRAPFIRTAGELLAWYGYWDNGGATTIDPLGMNEIRFEYGGNRKPRVHNPPSTGLSEQAQAFNGRVLPKVAPWIFDFESQNPSRDLVFPKGVSELQVVANIPTGTTVNANAKVHFIEEALFSGR